MNFIQVIPGYDELQVLLEQDPEKSLAGKSEMSMKLCRLLRAWDIAQNYKPVGGG